MQTEDILSRTLLQNDIQVQQIQAVCHEAGRAILAIYKKGNYGIQSKHDGSFVTDADLAAHEIIKKKLQTLTPQWPILSEEDANIPYSERSEWNTFWLVDPLDGTREFINHSEEFTVNIALVHQHIPVFGAVYIPVQGALYFGGSEINSSWMQVHDLQPKQIKTRRCAPEGILMTTVSRHMSEVNMPDLFNVLRETFKEIHIVEWAGAVKGCLVADGSIDLYPRSGQTYEWDTAAFHAIVSAAGGKVVDRLGNELMYNKKKSLLNSEFYVVGDAFFNWNQLFRKTAD